MHVFGLEVTDSKVMLLSFADLEEIQQSMEAIEEKMKGYLSRSSFGGRGYCRLDSKKMQLCYEQKRVVKKLEEQCKKDSIFTGKPASLVNILR